jgi:parallel beta-helix repeat protein
MPTFKHIRVVCWLALLLAVFALSVSNAGVARALGTASPTNTIEVFPGTNALTNALASAHNGDTLNIHTGTYSEAIIISKRNLILQAAGDGAVTVDGGCNTQYTIAVRANGVTIKGLRVIGADEGFGSYPAEIDFTNVTSGAARNNTVEDTCNAEYGINLFNTGPISVINNKATGFSDSGIYIGGITSTPGGALRAKRNESYGNHEGIIIEDSNGGTIRVNKNQVHDNTTDGIFVRNSDAVTINGNTVTNNVNSGVELDASSDNNRVLNNIVSGHTYDLANDGGTGNCFENNTYTTSNGTISC